MAATPNLVVMGQQRSPLRVVGELPSADVESAGSGSIDEEAITEEIPPQEDVFSYFIMTAPEEKKRYKTFTWDASMSYLLVALALLIQGVLLYCVYNKVVVNNQDWQDGIMDNSEDWKLYAPPSKGCNDGSSLCTKVNGTYTCAPPSVQLSGRWDELDLNGDDYWTREEVMKARADLKCKYAVDPVEIFDIFVQLILHREKYVWIHPDLRAGKSIHKSYFTYAMGDVVMCSYRNPDMCGNLLKRGVFHAPLKYGTSPRVGNSVESALNYCRNLLAPRGTCEKMLPSTYATWKIEGEVQCQNPRYSKFVYENPGSGGIKSLLAVDYKARERYETAKTLIFNIYKSFIVGVWILLIVSQLREVVKVLTWACFFPAEEPEDKEVTDSGRTVLSGNTLQKRGNRSHVEHVDEVTGITSVHRAAMITVNVIRIGMLCQLMYIGLSFLARQTDYIGLLLDGIALIFIIEVAEILYTYVLRDEVRHAWGDHESLQVHKFAGFRLYNTRPDMEDMFWLFVVLAMTAVFIIHLNVSLVTPLYDALRCTCLSEGEKCREAQMFNGAWWDKYWQNAVPETLKDIDMLKSAAKQATALFRKHQRPATLLSMGH